MKTILKVFPFVAMIAFMACEKDKDSGVNAIDESEAADMVAMALAENSAGATSVVETATSTTDKVVNEEPLTSESGLTLKSTSVCGFSHDTAYSVQSNSGMVITYDYSFSYSYSLSCNQFNMPESMSASYTYNGLFDAPRLQSNNNGSGALTISGLELSATTYSVKGSFMQDGSFQSKVRNKNSSNSDIEIDFIDLVINKGTYKIEGGTASAVLEGAVPQEGSFKYTCSITFNGDDTATVVINDATYLIDLENGEIVE